MTEKTPTEPGQVAKSQAAQSQRGGRIAARVQAGTAHASAAQANGATAAQDAEGAAAASGKKNKGLGRIIIAVYAVFALSAFARSTLQLFTVVHEAPVAIALSVVAAVVYIVATISLALPGRRSWYVALVAVLVELLGVIAVSILSYVDPQLFPKASVWSHFGSGYGYVPFILPFVGLWWLLTHRPAQRTDGAGA